MNSELLLETEIQTDCQTAQINLTSPGLTILKVNVEKIVCNIPNHIESIKNTPFHCKISPEPVGRDLYKL